MSDAKAIDELFYVNGLNASSGAYIEDPLTSRELAKKILQLERKRSNVEIRALNTRTSRLREAAFRPIMGVDERDLRQTGWGVIFAKDADPSVQDALRVLLDYRQTQTGDLYGEYTGDDGYLPGDTWESFRIRHHIGSGEADPQEMPYYLLIVGDPETIPYEFQYQADVERAVGRIYFDRPEDYANYAHSVVTAETQPLQLPCNTTFFATSNPDDRVTSLSWKELINPLALELKTMATEQKCKMTIVEPNCATKAKLAQLLGGSETPSLLFTATHGVGFNQDDPCHPRHQGALVTKEWPGPRMWQERLNQDFYFSCDDVSSDARLWGLIAVFFACFSAGTPRLSDFYHLKERMPQERLHLAEKAVLASLPQRLLSHPKGGALAVVGHVERAWPDSFKLPRAFGPNGHDIKAFRRLLSLLMQGFPIGAALEDMNSRYAEYATDLITLLYPIMHQGMTSTDEIKSKLAKLWTRVDDARNYIIIGDPAVRLRISEQEMKISEHPMLNTTGF